MEPKGIEQIASPDVQDFLFAHAHEDETRWLLSNTTVAGIAATVLAQQTAARRKAKEKLPTFYYTRGIVYPPKLNLEQTSSEATATYKAAVLRNYLGAPIAHGADLTGGWGVDAFFLSGMADDFFYAEPDAHLLALAQHNHRLLGRENVRYVPGGLPASLAQIPDQLDFIYLDPSRRAAGKKTVALEAYEPDVPSLMAALFQKTNHLLIKAAPLLDISLAARVLPGIKNVQVVAVEHECKELLFFCVRGYNGPVAITAIDLPEQEPLHFFPAEETTAPVTYAEPQTYLYEPNAAILKAGAFRLMAHRFQLAKLHVNTHLYTSNELVPNFPGRIFEITNLSTAAIPNKKAHVVTRNFPEAADSLKKKLRLTDGGDFYVLAFTSQRARHVLVCRKLR